VAGRGIPAPTVTGLVGQYGSTVAVHTPDLTARLGSGCAPPGPNGSGKTTTVEMCAGFLRPAPGRVRVRGLDPVAQRDRLRPRIGVMRPGPAAVVTPLSSAALADGPHTAPLTGGAPGRLPVPVLPVRTALAGGLAVRTARLT
jgi:hypothetical protein